MRICVLSGSPKGKNSITYQTVRYLEKRFPNDHFKTLHVGQRIRQYEKDLSEALNIIEKADLLLFCYPVYTFIAPSQLHRFIELVKQSGVDLSSKFAAQLCTSKHFYDVTAMNYVKENCLDLGLHYVGALSADMDDLLHKKGQDDADAFWNLVHFRMEHGIFDSAVSDTHAKSVSASSDDTQEEVSSSPSSYVCSGIVTEKKPGKRAVIVADLKEGDADLAAMIEDFKGQWPHECRVVNLNEFPFAGGCLGCFHCAVSGKCIYKDGFDSFLRDEIQTHDTILYAFRIQDHSMGSRMKMYDDRQFCNGHRTVTTGMPMGYLIQGDLASEPNLQMIIEGRANVGGNFLAGVALDSKGVTQLVDTLEYALENKLTQPSNFLGVGGMKIFRDLIWTMQGMMKADHRFYKEHGLYDFPQKNKGTILKMKLVGALISSPKIQSKISGKMTEGMLMPYENLLKKL